MVAKDTRGKPKLGLVPRAAMEEMAKVREFGIEKYKDDEMWRQVPESDFIHATLRHIFKYLDGENIDPESNLEHLSHALCSLSLAVAVKHMRGKK